MVRVHSILLFVALLSWLAGTGWVQAQHTFHWIGDPGLDTGDGNFATPSHWSSASVGVDGPPTAGDFALFDYSGTYTISVNGQQTKWTELGGGNVTFDGDYSTGTALLGKNGGGVLNLSSNHKLTCTEASTASLIVGDTHGGQLLLEGMGTKVVVSQGGVLIGSSGVTGWLSLKSGAKGEFTGPADQYASTVFGVGGGSSGTGVVEGDGSMMDIKRGGLEIGRSGTGRVDVISKGRIQVEKAPDVASVLLGSESGGDGTLVVSGTGSEVTMSVGGLEVGRSGTGRVDVIGGAKMTFLGNQLSSAVLASQAGGNGTIVVSGSGSEMRATGGFTVGGRGTAGVFLTTGGLLQIDKGSTQMGLLVLGADTTGNGYVSVDGTGTRCEVDRTVVVGQTKTGRLDASAGGELTVHGQAGSPALIVGGSAAATGNVYVFGAGSKVSLLQGEAVIGDGAKGGVSVAGFNSFTLHGVGDDLIVGNATGGDGTLDIGSPAATVETKGDLVVGRGGKGKVTLLGAGSVLTSYGGEIGAGGDGEVTINGAPWYSETSIVVGGTSKGTLQIGAGGAVFAPLSVTIGNEAGSDGTVFLANDGSLNTSILFFGQGKGGLYLTAGSDFEALFVLLLGHYAGADHTILVDGAGSQFIAHSDVLLGLASGGKGNFFLTNAGEATIARNLSVGADGQGSCSVNSGSTLIVGQITQVVRGILTVDASGYGSKSLGILGGGVVLLTNAAASAISTELLIGPGGVIEVNGSSRMGIGTIAAQQLSDNAITVGPGGALISSGAIIANVINKGGTVKLLNAPIATPPSPDGGSQAAAPPALGIQGSYEQTADGVLHVIITGPTAGADYAQLVATSANVAGKIILEFQQGFAPASGQVFDLVQSPNTTISPNVTVEVRNLAPGFQYNLAVVDGNYRLTAQSNGVPAPAYACNLQHVPGLYLQVSYTGILQSSTNLIQWTDVPGGAGYSFQVPEKDMVGQKFFRVRAFP